MSDDQASRDRFTRIADLFHRALDQPAAERARLLSDLGREHPDVIDEVTALLGAHERAEVFIERPALSEEARRERPLPPLPKDPVGHYRLLSVVAEGGMGVIYLAEDTRLGRTVALKAVRSALVNDPARLARLRREARAAAALSHPHVATIYAFEEIDGHSYIASEFVAGETLRAELARGPLAPGRVRAIGLAIAGALGAAHERGIVHRDIKPENIVTTPDGGVKVLDFGLAQVSDAEPDGVLTADGAVLGTPAYMAPEQIRGGTVDGRADFFALGVTLYELAAGRHPFAGATPAVTIARILESRPVRLDAALPAGSRADPACAALAVAVDRCLEKAVDRRPPTADALVAMLTGTVEARKPLDEQAQAVVPPPTTRAAVPRGATGPGAWWWQFHQAATTLAYVLLLVPLWNVRDMNGGSPGPTLFFVGLVAAVVSMMLRLHLWFALRQYPGEWATDHRVARRVRAVADVAFAVVLAARGFTAVRVDDPSAALFLSSAAAIAVAFVIIEPATAKAMTR